MKYFIQFLACTIGMMLMSCSSTGSSSNQAEKIDENVEQFKSWNYKHGNGTYSASIYSDNYYVSDRGENLYGAITLITDGRSLGSYLSIYVHASDEHTPTKDILFPQNQSSFIVSFDNSQFINWPAYPSESGLTLLVDSYEQWLNTIISSKQCIIDMTTDFGNMRFTFNNLNGLQWNP